MMHQGVEISLVFPSENNLQTEYYRSSSRVNGHRNIRCFPRCSDCHLETHFCGRPLRFVINILVQRNSVADLNRFDLDSICCVGEFREVDRASTLTSFLLGSSLGDLIKSKKSYNKTLYWGKQVSTYKPEEINNSSGSYVLYKGVYEMNSELRSWQYPTPNNVRFSSQQKHVFSITLLSPGNRVPGRKLSGINCGSVLQTVFKDDLFYPIAYFDTPPFVVGFAKAKYANGQLIVDKTLDFDVEPTSDQDFADGENIPDKEMEIEHVKLMRSVSDSSTGLPSTVLPSSVTPETFIEQIKRSSNITIKEEFELTIPSPYLNRSQIEVKQEDGSVITTSIMTIGGDEAPDTTNHSNDKEMTSVNPVQQEEEDKSNLDSHEKSSESTMEIAHEVNDTVNSNNSQIVTIQHQDQEESRKEENPGSKNHSLETTSSEGIEEKDEPIKSHILGFPSSIVQKTKLLDNVKSQVFDTFVEDLEQQIEVNKDVREINTKDAKKIIINVRHTHQFPEISMIDVIARSYVTFETRQPYDIQRFLAREIVEKRRSEINHDIIISKIFQRSEIARDVEARDDSLLTRDNGGAATRTAGVEKAPSKKMFGKFRQIPVDIDCLQRLEMLALTTSCTDPSLAEIVPPPYSRNDQVLRLYKKATNRKTKGKKFINFTSQFLSLAITFPIALEPALYYLKMLHVSNGRSITLSHINPVASLMRETSSLAPYFGLSDVQASNNQACEELFEPLFLDDSFEDEGYISKKHQQLDHFMKSAVKSLTSMGNDEAQSLSSSTHSGNSHVTIESLIEWLDSEKSGSLRGSQNDSTLESNTQVDQTFYDIVDNDSGAMLLINMISEFYDKENSKSVEENAQLVANLKNISNSSNMELSDAINSNLNSSSNIIPQKVKITRDKEKKLKDKKRPRNPVNEEADNSYLASESEGEETSTREVAHSNPLQMINALHARIKRQREEEEGRNSQEGLSHSSVASKHLMTTNAPSSSFAGTDSTTGSTSNGNSFFNSLFVRASNSFTQPLPHILVSDIQSKDTSTASSSSKLDNQIADAESHASSANSQAENGSNHIEASNTDMMTNVLHHDTQLDTENEIKLTVKTEDAFSPDSKRSRFEDPSSKL